MNLRDINPKVGPHYNDCPPRDRQGRNRGPGYNATGRRANHDECKGGR